MEFAPCPRCYQMNPPNAEKCSACGASMDEAPADVAPLALKQPEPEAEVQAEEGSQPATAAPSVVPPAEGGSLAAPAVAAVPPAPAVPPTPPSAAAPHQPAPAAPAALPADLAAQAAALEEQIAAKPAARALYLKLADLYQHAGHKDGAIHALERLLGVDPGNALAKHRIDVLRGTVHHAPPVTAVHPVTRPPHPTVRPARRRSSRRPIWIGVGALGLVVAAGAVWLLFSGPTRLGEGRAPVFSPQGDRLAYFTDAADRPTLNVYDLRSGRSRPLGPASGFGSDAVAWSPDGRQIAFTAPGEGEYGLEAVFVADVESGARRELANGSSPTWSPDGLSIGMFCHQAPQPIGGGTEEDEAPMAFTPGWYGVCLVSVADGGVRRLHEGQGSRLAFSPRSQTLVLERFPDEIPDAAAASGGGGDDEIQSLADEAVAGRATNFAEGSRDLRRAAEARGLDKRGAAGIGSVFGNLFAVDADSGAVKALTDDGRSSSARWTADGRIVYVHQPQAGTAAELWVMEADGSGRQPLLKAPLELFDPGAVGVGGDRVVYAGPVKDVNPGMAKLMTGEEAADLHVARLSGGAARRLKNRHTFKQRFALSPDGRRIVYEANNRKTGQSELWLMKP